MKLYLSSYRLGDNPERLTDLIGSNKRVAVIVNAIDDDTYETRKEKLEKEFEDLLSLGLQPEEIDLRDYFGKEKDLREKLQNFGGVWVRGGNTFILCRAMSYSGFDSIIKEKIKDKNFVYAGYSAGICILAPRLKGLDVVDDPNIVPEGYKKDIIWEGLGILDYYIAPHYQSDHPESASVEEEVAYLEQHNLPFKTLHDGDVIITEVN